MSEKSKTPEREVVLGVYANLFKGGDRPVYILPDGRFAWKNGVIWSVHKTLAAALKAMDKTAQSITLFRPDAMDGADKPFEATHWKGSYITTKDGKRIHVRSWGASYYVYDATIAANIGDLNAQESKLRAEYENKKEAIGKRRDGIKAKLKRVTEYNFKAVRDGTPEESDE